MNLKNTQYNFCILALMAQLVFGQESYTLLKQNIVDISSSVTIRKSNQNIWLTIGGVLKGGDGINKVYENSYLISEKTFEDFEFRDLFSLTRDYNTDLINSGIQYRSIIEGNNIIGYQGDTDKGYWGDFYDEHRPIF